MAVAAREPLGASVESTVVAPRRPTRAELKRALAELESRLWRDGLRLRAVREQGGDVALLQRRWTKLLRSYERLAQHLDAASA